MATRIKTGGRKRGTPNRATVARQEPVAASGLTPLDYLLAVMRDETVPAAERMEAAKAAAPYVHPRLASIEHGGRDGGPIEQVYEVRRTIVDPRPIEGPAVRRSSATSSDAYEGVRRS